MCWAWLNRKGQPPPILTFLPKAEPVPVDDLVAGRHDLLLIVAIVNPLGPTVYARKA